MKLRSKIKSSLSVILAVAMIIANFPVISFAAQSNEYVDPADSWLSSNNRTNELDVNATTTYETQHCTVCDKNTMVITYRVPEYTKSGETALNRGVKYSDGTLIDGIGKGNLDDGTPGVDAYYTGYHFTKSVCQNCGTINTTNNPDSYHFNRNVYMLNSCDSSFFLEFDATTYQPYSDTQHRISLKRGEYCKFCKGTYARATLSLERHSYSESVDAQLGNNRFYVSEVCDDCGYETNEYVTAKSVVTSYYGIEDGEAHTITVTDLSDSGVNTSIRYGNSANNCNLSTAPNYTQPGYYTVYYKINYTYSGESMTENGVSYVHIVGNEEDEDIILLPATHEHEYHYLETVPPTCEELGYERFQCGGCGDLEKRNYVPATGHDYDEITIREATCKQNGLILTICNDCGTYYQETTALGNHDYHTERVAPTCRLVGYDEHTCEVCGDSYITNMTSLINHSYAKVTKAPDCVNMGYSTYTCTMCGSGYVDDYVSELGHDWDEGHMVTSSTCTGEGVIEFRCQYDGCNEKMIQATAAAGHTPGSEASCTEPQKCTVCNTILTLPKGHSYNSVVTAPTCTSSGFTTHTCQNCSDSYVSDYTDPVAHDYEETVFPPSCTEMGFSVFRCADCDDEYNANYVDMTEHNFIEEVIRPSCTELGYSKFNCADCDANYIGNYTDKLPHNYNKEVIPPTCTEHGHSVFVCPDCNASYIDEIVESTNHNYEETVIPATCTNLGYSIFKCSDCGDEYTGNYVGKLAHDYEATVFPSSCTGLGHTHYQCKNCDDEYRSNYTEPTGHNPSDWITDTAATIQNAGTKHIECLNCGITLQSAQIPQLIDEDRSDEDGSASVGAYSIILTDSHNIPVFDSDIMIDVNDIITIKLPEGRLLDYNDQVTVTVFHTETQEAVQNLQLFIYDAADNAATGKTNINGQLKVPNNQSSTGDDNGTIGKDENEQKLTFVVRVANKENVVITNCDVYIGESNNIVVDLPDGIRPSVNSPVIVTVTDQNGNAQKNVTIIALGESDYIEKGKTDVYGRITLPMVSEGYTNNQGHITVDNINVIVNDETGLIENAFVKHNEDGSILVKLPEGRNISYENRVTVTLIDSKGMAIANKKLFISDFQNESYTDKTNSSGKVIVPPANTDYTDENGFAKVDGYCVTITDEQGYIENAFVTHTENNILDIKLPPNFLINYANRITVKVTDENNGPVKDLGLIVNEVIIPNESGEEDTSADSSAEINSDGSAGSDGENESDKATYEPKSVSGVTNAYGVAVFPPLSEDITDNEGNSGIEETKPGEGENPEEVTTEYKVVVSDTKGVVGDALVKIEDGKITVTLPGTHSLTTSNQTSVTVTGNDNKAVKGVSVTIKDKTTSKSGTTDANGKVTLPVKQTSTPSSRPSYSSGGGGGSYSSTSIKVVDKDGKNVSVSRTNGTNISTLTLLAGKNLAKDDNYYEITVTSSSKPKKGYVITLKDRNGNEVKGATDEDGKLILPSIEHKSYILGYPDGSFRPNGNMTRSEAAAIFARVIADKKGEQITGKSSFEDVKGTEWYTPYVSYLEKYDVLKGYSDNTFRAENKVTRAEFVAMSVRYYSLFNELPEVENTTKYSDVSSAYWAVKEISAAKEIGWLNGYADGTFRGDNEITRAEAVTVINRATGRTPDKEHINENYTKLDRFTDVTDSSAWFFHDVLSAANTIQCADCPHLD